MRKNGAIHPADPPAPASPLSITCPICDVAPGADCSQPADWKFPNGSNGHHYRQVVAQEAQVARLIQQGRATALAELDTLMRNIGPGDLTTNEVLAFIGILRPAYERYVRDTQRRSGDKLRLVGAAK